MAILTVGYHNLAVELEFLKDMEGALEAYQSSYETAKNYLGALDNLAV